jgi:hypothetical protein
MASSNTVVGISIYLGEVLRKTWRRIYLLMQYALCKMPNKVWARTMSYYLALRMFADGGRICMASEDRINNRHGCSEGGSEDWWLKMLACVAMHFWPCGAEWARYRAGRRPRRSGPRDISCCWPRSCFRKEMKILFTLHLLSITVMMTGRHCRKAWVAESGVKVYLLVCYQLRSICCCACGRYHCRGYG